MRVRTSTRTLERADAVAARQALRQRRADALDPALLAAAGRVRAALVSARYDATQGTDDFAHCVTVRHVTSDDLGAVDGITQRAAAPMWGDCRHAQSYITVRLTAGRAVELEARWIARKGDDGIVFAPGVDGPLTQYGTRAVHPVACGDYDD